MKKIFLIFTLALSNIAAMAQLGTVSNNKPLGYINPALQNYEMDKGTVSASYVINPFVKDTTPAGLLAIAEFKVNEKFRFGINAFQVENRLSKTQPKTLAQRLPYNASLTGK